ncbi:MAG TPA: hypothetical protein PLB89_05265 [Flavobacteriales bacterium]|nr:hypothetical protein [Flavobacteriales bacterium]
MARKLKYTQNASRTVTVIEIGEMLVFRVHPFTEASPLVDRVSKPDSDYGRIGERKGELIAREDLPVSTLFDMIDQQA